MQAHDKLFKRIPHHVGFIPDGNRRWAAAHNLSKEEGYAQAFKPTMQMLQFCQSIGIKEITLYGCSVENMHRPAEQVLAFTNLFLQVANYASENGFQVLVVGDTTSPLFPKSFLPFTETKPDNGKTKLNLLINYHWEWDFREAIKYSEIATNTELSLDKLIGSHEISPIDIIVRFGGTHRFSGFLPIQSTYADLYIINELWPDNKFEHLKSALLWFDEQSNNHGL